MPDLRRTQPALSSARPSRLARVWQGLDACGPYAGIAMLYLLALPLLSASRAALLVWQSERVAATGLWGTALLQGVRVDLIQVSLLSVPLLLLAPLLATRRSWAVWRGVNIAWVTLAIATLGLLEISSPAFITEYDSRPNRLFVEYLKYPEEVVAMLWKGFRLHLLGGLAVTGLLGVVAWRVMRAWPRQVAPWSGWRLWLSWPLLLLVCALLIRSSLQHRPANPASFALSADPMVNTLILNSAWSVTHALYGLRHESRSSEIYGKMEPGEVMAEFRTARAAIGRPHPLLNDPDIPTLVAQQASIRRDKPLNLVIILEESLGATFVGSLGGVPVTPELEKLKHEGWWFEQLYATGTRSIRGIEAVTTGFLPTPAQAVVKLSLAQRNFSTLASILGRHGYGSEFIYGGEAHFDNMRGFFTGNGFTRITERKDYKDPRFVASWGVSDEDLFDKAHERLAAKHAEGRPSFTLVFTSTNHAPFEFPAGRIELHEQPQATDRNAVKYTDHALGRFIARAKASPYWRDTVFLVVADHDIRVRGDSLVPIERFHIPGLILGADIQPRRVKTIASQIALAPTLLSLMGVDARHPMPGRDLTREADDEPGRAMMQFEQHYAWMEGERVVVLRPEKAPAFARYDRSAKRLGHEEAPPADGAAQARRALAHALLPAWLYREQRYRLPD